MAQYEFKEQLECVDVQFEDNNQKAVMTYIDEQFGEVREINYNLQVYDRAANKWVPDEKQAEKVRQWCREHFNLEFEELGQAIGMRKDLYCYPNFNSLHEVQMLSKFEEDMLGQIFEVEIVNALDDGKRISLQFEYEGNLYESKMQYADYLEARQEWFINPQKRKKQYEKFAEKFLMPVEEIANMVGKTVLVEVKKAMGKYIYCEIKPFKKPKAAKKA